MTGRVYYAIGDIHGEADRLAALHDRIRWRHARFAAGQPAAIVHLGDLVDRGPDSRGVIAFCRRQHADPGEGFEIVTLRGNHEQMMLEACAYRAPADVAFWLRNGGGEALASYAAGMSAPPDDPLTLVDPEDLAFLRGLPTLFRDEARGLVFVHAGIDPETFPACDDQVRLWTRSARFFDESLWPARPELDGQLVIHGHTPTEDGRPHLGRRRINIDTGAVFGGPLTCVVLAAGAPPAFLST